MKKYLKMTGFILLYPGIFILVQILCFMVVGLLVVFSKQVALGGNHIHIAGILSAVISLFLYSIIYRKKGKRLFRLLRLSKIAESRPALLAPTGVALSLLSVFFFIFFQELGIFESSLAGYYELFQQLLEGNIIILILSVGFLIPLVEEVIFRELVFNELKKNITIRWALIIQAILFGIFHMQVVQGIFAVLTGMLLGLVYIWLKTIWAPIILHSCINTSSILLSRMVNEEVFGGASAVFILYASIFFVVISFICIYKGSRHKNSSMVKQAF